VFATLAGAVAYAHAQGVLHRDIKSSNILIDEARHPWLIDFGLALRVVETNLSDETARVAGTPTHFAPELRAGAAASEQSDQYAFFVTLIEALTGHRPFAGDAASPTAWHSSLSEDLQAFLRQGIAEQPDQRFASMLEVQSALTLLSEPAVPAVPARRARKRWMALGVGLALAAVATTIVVGLAPSRPSTSGMPACDPYAGTLGLPLRLLAQQRMRELPVTTAENLIVRLNQLQQHGAELCQQFAAREVSSEQLARRQLCLRSTVLGVMSRLGRLDPAQMLDGLPGVNACTSDVTSIDDLPLPASVSSDDVLGLRAALADLDTRSDWNDNLALLDQQGHLVTRARTLAYAPLLAEALNQRASLAQNAGDIPTARAALDEAIVVATRSNNRAALARSYYINIIVQNDLGASTEADRALALARAATSEQPLALQLRVELAGQTVAIHRGRSSEAIPALRTLLQRCQTLSPLEPLLCIDIHQALIAALFEARRIDELRLELPLLDRTITEQLGRDNQRYAVFLANQIGLGTLDESQRLAQTALLILQNKSPHHPKIIPLLQNLGMIANNRGDTTLGLTYTKRALAAARARFGDHSAAVAHIEINIATGLINLDDNDAATPLLVHAEQVMANIVGGASSPFLAAARSMLAEIYAGRNDTAAAYALLVPLVASQQRPEADPAQRGRDEFLLAQVAWTLGNRDEAVRAANLAVRDLTAAKAFPATLKQARAWLAQPSQR
jgi:eukaryotic-like serine/threonine-protein kinase